MSKSSRRHGKAALGAAAALLLAAPAVSLADSPAQRAQQVDRVEREAHSARAASGMAAAADTAPSCTVPATVDLRSGGATWIDPVCEYDPADGRPTLRVTQMPAHGLVDAYSSWRSIHYTADSGYDGSDSVKFVVSNAAGQSPEYTVALNVSGARNTAPDCAYVAGALQTSGDVVYGHALVRPGVKRDLASFCADAEGDDISFQIKQAPAAGTLTSGAAEHGYPTLSFTAPGDAAAGTKYQAVVVAQDEHGLTSEEWLIGFEVTDENTAPSCGSSSVSSEVWMLAEQGESSIARDAWCHDAEGDAITLSVLSQPENAVAAVTADHITITPSAASGTGTFTYRGTDSLDAQSEPASVSVNYVSPHSDPSCADKTVDVPAATRTEFAVVCTDADGDLIDPFAHPGTHGQLSIAGKGHVEVGLFADGQLPLAYTPRAGFAGQDGFAVASWDQYDHQVVPAKVTLNVAGAGGGNTGGGDTGGGSTPPVVTPDPKVAMTTFLTSETVEFLQLVARANKKGLDARRAVLSLGVLGADQLPNGGTGQFRVYDKPAAKLARAAAAKKKKRKLLGATKVTIAKGQSKKVQVKLNRKGKSLLKKKGKVKLSLDATLTDALTGASVTQSKTYTFKVKKKKRK